MSAHGPFKKYSNAVNFFVQGHSPIQFPLESLFDLDVLEKAINDKIIYQQFVLK